KVDELFKHFKDLSDAHRELERVRQQRDLLLPIEKHGAEYNRHAEQLRKEDRILAAAGSYFPKRIVELFEPEIERCQTELNRVRADQQRLKSDIDVGLEQCRKLKNEIDQASGDRMREIPALIETHTAKAEGKRTEFARLRRALEEGGLREPISTQGAFDAMRARLVPLRHQLQLERTAAEQEHANVI